MKEGEREAKGKAKIRRKGGGGVSPFPRMHKCHPLRMRRIELEKKLVKGFFPYPYFNKNIFSFKKENLINKMLKAKDNHIFQKYL